MRMTADARQYREEKALTQLQAENLELLKCNNAVMTLQLMRDVVTERRNLRWSVGGLAVGNVWMFVWQRRVIGPLEYMRRFASERRRQSQRQRCSGQWRRSDWHATFEWRRCSGAPPRGR